MNKYNPQNLSVRSRAQIRESLLSHPDNRGRREELELLIDWRLAKETYLNESGARILSAFLLKMGDEESPALRALTLLNEMNGGEEVFKTASPELITFDWERYENVARYPVVAALPTQNMIDFGSSVGELFNTRSEKPDSAQAFVDQHFVGGVYGSSTPRPS